MSDLAYELATFVSTADVDVPGVALKTRTLLADAVVLARSASSIADVVAATAAVARGPGPVATWIGDGGTDAVSAVFVNALATHARFQDDCEMSSWTHPASIVCPVALAVGQTTGASVRDVLGGIAAGYAVAHWLGGGGEVAHAVMARGYRPSPTFGPIMAAAAAARVARLDVDATAEAVRTAAVLGRGTLHGVAAGGTDHRVHNATAAVDGYLTAVVGACRPGAAVGSFEGVNGFLDVHAGLRTVPGAWHQAPHVRSVLDVWHKPAPMLGDNCAAYLVAQRASTELELATLRSIRIEVFEGFASFPGTQSSAPFRTAVAAVASLRHAVARALLSGSVRWEDYEPQRRNDVAVQRLVELIEIVGRGDLSPVEARLQATDVDGSFYEWSTDDRAREALFRDERGQREVADGLLGALGAGICNGVFGSQPDDDCGELLSGLSARG